MKIILEGQLLADNYIRGMNNYVKSLANTLIKRGNNKYSITIFDYNRERKNREKVVKHLYNKETEIFECNTISYRDLMKKDQPYNQDDTYQSVTGAYGDIYHFMSQIGIPPEFKGNTVITIHDLIPMVLPNLFDENVITNAKYIWARICKQRPFIIADSNSTKDDICNFDSSLECKIRVIPLAYHKDEFYADEQPQLLEKYGIKRPYILYLGAIDARKGADMLIKAFEIMSDNIENYELIFAGNEYNNILSNLITNNHYNSIIKNIGIVDNTTRRVLYTCADLFVFPSLYEGFGLPVLEAMACGTPVITSNTSSLPEVAGDAAILIDPTDVEQLAYEMERVLTSQSLRNDMIAKGFENCKRFSWDKTAEMTEEVYKIAYENNP